MACLPISPCRLNLNYCAELAAGGATLAGAGVVLVAGCCLVVCCTSLKSSVPVLPLCACIYDKAKHDAKNTVAQMPVKRVKKLALPAEPNTPCALPEPLPKLAPASAPLPFCISTKMIMLNDEKILIIQIIVLNASIIMLLVPR